MAFTITSEISEGIAKLTLSGSLDSSSASLMQVEIQKVATQAPSSTLR